MPELDIIPLLALAAAVMAAITRTAGGGLIADKLWSGLPELIFGAAFGAAGYHYADLHDLVIYDRHIPAWLAGLASWLWSYGWMEKGHGNFFHDGMFPVGSPNPSTGKPNVDDPEWLEKYTGLHWLLPKLGLAPRTAWYCRIMMGVKGLLIGLPAFPYGLALFVLWPLSYSFGFRILRRDSAPAEWLSGAFAGVVLCLAILAKKKKR